MAVCFFDRLEFPVFPELIAVAKLNACKSAVEVIAHGGKVQILVLGKVVVRRAGSAVTVADQDEFGLRVKGHCLGVMKRAV